MSRATIHTFPPKAREANAEIPSARTASFVVQPKNLVFFFNDQITRMSSKFFTNSSERSLFDKFTGIIDGMKDLYAFHAVAKGDEIDLFPLLINGVLKHFKSAALTGDKELGELWGEVQDAVAKPTEGSRYNLPRKKTDVDHTIQQFNGAFRPLFEKDGIENILTYAHPILDKFGHNISVALKYVEAKPNSTYTAIDRGQVRASIEYNGKPFKKPHLFLNEARLSALAISLYLGMVKRHVQGILCKVLFLDDIFIGLDIGNRLPLFEILDADFKEYQLIITTYDKSWYEFVRVTYLEGNSKWKGYEFCARRTRKGFEVPVVRENTKDNSHIQNYIDKAEEYFNDGDNKAAGVYLRSAFEFLLKRYWYGKVPIAELRWIFAKVMVEYEQEIGWPESDKGKPWSDAELQVVLSDAPTKENCVKHAKAFGRGYGALEQINPRLLHKIPVVSSGPLFQKYGSRIYCTSQRRPSFQIQRYAAYRMASRPAMV